MEVSVVATALEQSRKRPRDACNNFLISEEGPEAGLPAKDICPLHIEDVNTSFIPEEVSEVNQSLDYVKLNEVQETLIHGVMRSFEEELEVSKLTSSCLSEEQLGFASFLFGDETRLSEYYSLHKGIELSTSSAEVLESFELPFLFDSVFYCSEKSEKFNEMSISVSANVVEADHGAEKAGDVKSDDYRRLDIGYLLEASDGELGIAPSPCSGSFSSETDFLYDMLQGTDMSGSNNNTVDFEQFWDLSSESLFELAQDDDYSNHEMLRTVSPFEMIPDPVAIDNSIIETSSTYLKPAGASH